MSSEAHGPASSAPGRGAHEEEHEEHMNHEAWVIPYADMLTLLMALFLMMWATSNSDQAKFSALADSLRDALGQGTGETYQSVLEGNPGLLDGQVAGLENADRANPTDPEMAVLAELQRQQQEAQAEQNATLNGVEERIRDQATAEGVMESIQFRRESRGLVVSIVADPVLFDTGSTDLRPAGARILNVVTDALRGVPNDVVVEGHTDNQPISTPQYPTNWELSTNRGTSVLRYMIEQRGYNPNKISSTGYGETRPVAPNDTEAQRAQNRRVELVVLSAPTDPLETADE
jgi:chemotaxis protein MotB